MFTLETVSYMCIIKKKQQFDIFKKSFDPSAWFLKFHSENVSAATVTKALKASELDATLQVGLPDWMLWSSVQWPGPTPAGRSAPAGWGPASASLQCRRSTAVGPVGSVPGHRPRSAARLAARPSSWQRSKVAGWCPGPPGSPTLRLRLRWRGWTSHRQPADRCRKGPAGAGTTGSHAGRPQLHRVIDQCYWLVIRYTADILFFNSFSIK